MSAWIVFTGLAVLAFVVAVVWESVSANIITGSAALFLRHLCAVLIASTLIAGLVASGLAVAGSVLVSIGVAAAFFWSFEKVCAKIFGQVVLADNS